MTRTCGSCSLCCKLLPMSEERDSVSMETVEAAISVGLMTRKQANDTTANFTKPSGERCPHQRLSKGCAIYDRRPFGCRFWNCRWLLGDDTADLSRPDRCHYVIDVMPDYVTAEDGGREVKIPIIQVWVDSGYPDAHRDPALRSYLLRRSEEGWAALVRYNNQAAVFIVAPPMAGDGQWHEILSIMDKTVHSIEDKIRAMGQIRVELAS